VGHSNLDGVDRVSSGCDFGSALLARAAFVCLVAPAMSARVHFFLLDLGVPPPDPRTPMVLAGSLGTGDNVEHRRAVRQRKANHSWISGPILSESAGAGPWEDGHMRLSG